MALTLLPGDLDAVVRGALAEDVGTGDLTTDALLDPTASCVAELLLKEPGTVSGLAAAEQVFRALDPLAQFEALIADGTTLRESRTLLARVAGRSRALLTGERTALNLLGRLSGIATLTRRYVDAVEGTGAIILDTRKTTPGLRAVEKEAVRHGGGQNHRLGLYDAILVKDNHLVLAGGIRTAVDRLRRAGTGIAIEVEADSLDDVSVALEAGADRILLDNMAAGDIAKAVALGGSRAVFEASGGITLANVREIAETGVQYISVGALTHSARSLDVSMEVLP
jgi:nicotinate-nucleotide pyrophosphorylase (carboxylating)